MTSPFIESWIHFDLCLGLTTDLLPVVADHTIAPSPTSQVKSLGKVPGRVVASGAVGFPKWTEHRSTPKDIERWSADPRLGLCLQTKHVRALDIDVDHAEAAAIADVFTLITGKLPLRYRSNSRKHLLALIVEGDDLHKRAFKTEHGLVELLATGQQFIVDSVHPSGERYQWEGGLPSEIPTVSAGIFEAAWTAIVERFAIEAPSSASARKRGESFAANDPVAEHLVDEGLVIDGDDEKLYVRCPWAETHSGESGPSETAWMVAGSSGYDLGHFACKHASCASRTDDDFREALGIGTSSDFAVVAELPGELPAPPGRPRFLGVNVKTGEIDAKIDNVMTALEAPKWFGVRVAYDTFLGETVIGYDDGPGWRPIRDADVAIMRRRLDKLGFKPVGPELMRSAISGVCEHQRIDSAIEWLDGLKWDGVPRVEPFLSTVFGTEDSEYTRAVSLYWWTAQAGRVLAAPCQADMVPILISPEGQYKTTTLQALVPNLDCYTKIDLEHRDADLSRKMRGALLGEIEEMRGLQGRSGEGNKSFITNQVEEWVEKYKENKTRYPRRLLLVGTSNDEDLIDGESGRRRWLPVRVGHADRALARSIYEQLWAEGAQLFRNVGVLWADAHLLGKEEIKHFLVEDMWHAEIAKWVDSVELSDTDTEVFTTTERVARGALMLDASKQNRAVSNRICKILRELGFKGGYKRENGRLVNGWRRAISYECQVGVSSVSGLSA